MQGSPRQPAPAKAAICAAALELFASRGVEAVSVRDIAKAAGFSNPALFRHFASKERLARTLFETAYRALAAAVETPAAREGFAPWLAAALAEVVRAPAATHFVLANLRVYWPSMPGDLRPKSLPRLTQEMLERAKAEGSMRGDLDVPMAALVVLGTLGQIARGAHFGDEAPASAVSATSLAALLTQGFAADRRR